MGMMMQRIKAFFAKREQRRTSTKDMKAKRDTLDELFHDIYSDRKRIYKVNFVRGIFFGLGSVIGGTVIVALIVWTLSLFVNVPVLGELFETTQNSIEETTDNTGQ